MTDFVESGMKFSFPEEELYHIEKSQLLGQVGLKTCECVVARDGGILLIEAKSSSPNKDNKEDFDSFIAEIKEKFAHSLLFYNAVRLRHQDEVQAENLLKLKLEDVDYKFFLIIKGHQENWLPPIMEALKVKMKHLLRLYNVLDTSVKVINENIAQNLGLISGLA